MAFFLLKTFNWNPHTNPNVRSNTIQTKKNQRIQNEWMNEFSAKRDWWIRRVKKKFVSKESSRQMCVFLQRQIQIQTFIEFWVFFQLQLCVWFFNADCCHFNRIKILHLNYEFFIYLWKRGLWMFVGHFFYFDSPGTITTNQKKNSME